MVSLQLHYLEKGFDFALAHKIGTSGATAQRERAICSVGSYTEQGKLNLHGLSKASSVTLQ
jgi:hypothetical protein